MYVLQMQYKKLELTQTKLQLCTTIICNFSLSNLLVFLIDIFYEILQAMAVLDRVNVEHLPLINIPQKPLKEMENAVFLPSFEDLQTMKQDFIQVRT